MLIKLLRTGTEKHVDRDLADTLIQAGLAEEVVRAGAPKEPGEPACRVAWTLTSGQSGVPMIRGECAACGLTAFGSGRVGARQVHLWHRGRKEQPPQELVAKVFALPEESRWTQTEGKVFESLQASGDPWRDYQTVTNGKRPSDPPMGPVAQAMSGDTPRET